MVVLIAGLAALDASGSTAAFSPVRVADPVAGPPSSIAALGDSFNTGFAAGSAGGDPRRSRGRRATTRGVDSVYLRLLLLHPAIREHRFLIAKDGSRISDLARQIGLAADHGAQLITVQSGGNDICGAKDAGHATSPELFREQFTHAIGVLRTRLPNARLLLTSITDEGRWNDGSVQIPGNGSKLSDGTVCDPEIGGSGKQDPARRTAIQMLERQDNAILRSVCATDPHCRWDGGAFYRLAYSAADISARDAFHPSIEGLGRFAETAWATGFSYADRVAPPSLRRSSRARRVSASH